jgi:hypothetical protein
MRSVRMKVGRLEQHMPWKLEVKAADGLGKDYCEFCQKLAGHKSKDCPNKYGRVINALNTHYEDDFRKQKEKKVRKVVQWMEVAGRDNQYLTLLNLS